MLLAAAPPDGLSGWIDSLQFVITLTLALTLLWGKLTGRSERREISFSGTPLDKKEHDAHVTENRNEHATIDGKILNTEKGLRTEIAELHTKVNKVDREVGGLITTTNLQNQQLAQIDTKVTRLLAENGGHPFRHQP